MKPSRFAGRRETRHNEAQERQAYRDSLTPRQQRNRLDKRLGKGVGAEKERARIAAAIKAENAEKRRAKEKEAKS